MEMEISVPIKIQLSDNGIPIAIENIPFENVQLAILNKVVLELQKVM